MRTYHFCLFFLNFIALSSTTPDLKSLQEITILQNNSTFIKNNEELLEKLNKVINGGRSRLQIVTDFDLTLTTDRSDSSKTVLNSYEMLRLCPSIPESYKEEDTKLFYIYKPIENDPNLTVVEKSKYMVEWYRASKNLLKGLKFPRDELKDIARNVSKSFRNGVKELITWSETNNVPILVLSSGLGDAVVASLDAADLLTPNVKVISNFLELDNADVIIGMKGEPIHSFNKNEASIKNTDYYETVKNRCNIILLGDSIGDADMSGGMDHCNVALKIGFLSKKKQDKLQIYLNKFDIVLLNEQTMDAVNAILNMVL